MTTRTPILAAVIVAIALSGCSTRPRNFAAQVAAPVPDRLGFESDYHTCATLVRSGHTSNFKGAALTGLAAGAGTFGATAVAATAGGIGITGATTAASMAIPGVGLIAAFGMSRAIRGGKERKYKRAMTDCLAEYGYEVSSWAKLDKRDDPAAAAARLATAGEGVEAAPPAMATGGEPN